MNRFKTIKQSYQDATKYWHDLFPKLSSYVVFKNQLNKLVSAVIARIALYQSKLPAEIYASDSI